MPAACLLVHFSTSQPFLCSWVPPFPSPRFVGGGGGVVVVIIVVRAAARRRRRYESGLSGEPVRNELYSPFRALGSPWAGPATPPPPAPWPSPECGTEDERRPLEQRSLGSLLVEDVVEAARAGLRAFFGDLYEDPSLAAAVCQPPPLHLPSAHGSATRGLFPVPDGAARAQPQAQLGLPSWSNIDDA